MTKTALLYEASQAVLSTLDLDEVLRQILAIARQHFELRNVLILLLDPEKQDLWIRSQIGCDVGADNVRVPLGCGITGVAALLKKPVYVPDVSKDPNYIRYYEKTRSEVAIPMVVRGEVIGVLDCQSENLDHFNAETIELLQLFSAQASMAVQNARLYSLERRRASQMEAIAAIAQQTTAVLDLEQLLSKVCHLIRYSFDVGHVSVLLKEGDGEELVLRAANGKLTPRATEGNRFRAREGVWGQSLASGETLIQNNVAQAELYEETRSLMCAPLVSFGQIFGVLLLHSDAPDKFQPTDLPPLESVADICATAIQNTYYVERVKQLAYRDGLTGIFNRRFFELRMAEELERAQRFSAGMSIIMIDIDHFKELNDEFGHMLGDEVLRQVASLLHDQLRKFDVVCRYGGEEFAILLSQTNPQHAVGVAEKLRALLERWQFPGLPRTVTISAGVATYPENGVERDGLMKAADTSLYAAKQAGRNRVMLATAETRQDDKRAQGAANTT